MLDMFMFLKREELEEVQMVSREWNERIMKWTRGPLRTVKFVSHIPASLHFCAVPPGFLANARRRLFFGDVDPTTKNMFLRPKKKGIVGADMQMHGLRNTLVETLTLGADFRTLLKLEELACGEKIMCKTVRFSHFTSREYHYEAQLDVSLGKQIFKKLFSQS